MVVLESALLAAMRKAYKAEGYNVAKRGMGDDAVLELQALEWAVEITWKNVPPKILGLIVEHIQDLPAPGQAFTAKKGETATILYHMLEELPDAEEAAKGPEVCCWIMAGRCSIHAGRFFSVARQAGCPSGPAHSTRESQNTGWQNT